MGFLWCRTGVFYYFLVVALVFVIIAFLTASAISSTRINVDTNGVSGVGISRWFYFGDVRRFNFMLNFDQVSVSAKAV